MCVFFQCLISDFRLHHPSLEFPWRRVRRPTAPDSSPGNTWQSWTFLATKRDCWRLEGGQCLRNTYCTEQNGLPATTKPKRPMLPWWSIENHLAETNLTWMKWCFAMSLNLNQRYTVKFQCYLLIIGRKNNRLTWFVVAAYTISSFKMCMHHQIRFSALTVNLETPKKSQTNHQNISYINPNKRKTATAKPSVSPSCFFQLFFRSLPCHQRLEKSFRVPVLLLDH